MSQKEIFRHKIPSVIQTYPLNEIKRIWEGIEGDLLYYIGGRIYEYHEDFGKLAILDGLRRLAKLHVEEKHLKITIKLDHRRLIHINILWKNILNVDKEKKDLIKFFDFGQTEKNLFITYKNEIDGEVNTLIFYAGPHAKHLTIHTKIDELYGKIIAKMSIEKQRDGDFEHIHEEDPIRILKLRYAKGEITKKEFEEMKKDIEGN